MIYESHEALEPCVHVSVLQDVAVCPRGVDDEDEATCQRKLKVTELKHMTDI